MMLPFEFRQEINKTINGVSSHYTTLLNYTNNISVSLVLTDKDQLFLGIERALKVYYSLFLVILGTFFNILSIVILSRAAFRRTSTSVYLRFLACVDMFVLYNGLSRHFISGVSGYNIRNMSEGFCKFNYWSSSFGPDISAWILVAVTTERVISIVWPHKVKIVCSKTTAAATLIIVSVLIIASNIPLLIFYGDKKVEETTSNTTHISGRKCVPLKPEYEIFIDNVWYWIDLLKFVILPSIILIIFNIIIICFVIRSRRRVKMRSLSLTKDIIRPPPLFHNGVHNASSLDLDDKKRTIGNNKEMSLTITLVVVNATFLVCNTPVMVYFLGAQYWFPPGVGPTERLTLTACIMAMYTNNAVNFLLYCATGSKFRAEIYQLLPLMSKMNRMQNKDSVNYNSSCASVRKNESTQKTFEANVITITGSMETCYSQDSVS